MSRNPFINPARSRVIREAYEAGRQVSYNGGRVYVDGLLAHDPAAQDPQETAAEDKTRLWMYGEALKELAMEQSFYQSNLNLWRRWDDNKRLWWIEHAEAQARAGQNTIGAVVVARAVEIRLTRQML